MTIAQILWIHHVHEENEYTEPILKTRKEHEKDIIDVIIDRTKITIEDFYSKKRHPEIAKARHIFYKCARENITPRPSLEYLASLFGQKHETVISAVNSISDSIDTEVFYKELYNEVKQIDIYK